MIHSLLVQYFINPLLYPLQLICEDKLLSLMNVENFLIIVILPIYFYFIYKIKAEVVPELPLSYGLDQKHFKLILFNFTKFKFQVREISVIISNF